MFKIWVKLFPKAKISFPWEMTYFCFLLFVLTHSCGIRKSTHHLPEIEAYPLEKPVVTIINDSTSTFQNNFLTKNKQQIWELYIQGNPLQLGYNNGALTQKLMQNQEQIFFSKVENLVPSKSKQYLLRNFLKWYNRKMFLNVKDEFQTEIYGLSQYSSSQFNFIASPYLRTMYLHGAHDIGHALQDLAMVGCSSLAVWGDHTEDGSLLMGRNFDFYINDDFAKNKMVSFVKPDLGIPYASVGWPGMIGVVSGMNKEGISVTINAAKSKIPLTAKTPISLVTKEILQYATTLEEAITIAKSKKVFVSESILVASAKDDKAIIIEISPNNFGVFDAINSNHIICTNHFQSEAFKDDKRNNTYIKTSHSLYRYKKLEEMLANNKTLNPEKMISILREKSGLKEETLGYGNEKALNQLMAHHAVVFSPSKRLMWVSSNPYQLGEFVCYDLNAIFSNDFNSTTSLATTAFNISKDPFAESIAFKKYEEFKKINAHFKDYSDWNDTKIAEYQSLNPDYWMVYYDAGNFYLSKKEYAKAKLQFEKALDKIIPSIQEKEKVQKLLKKSIKKRK